MTDLQIKLFVQSAINWRAAELYSALVTGVPLPPAQAMHDHKAIVRLNAWKEKL